MSGFDSVLLADMRHVVDTVTMSDREKRLASKAVDQLEAHWLGVKQERYAAALSGRDDEHETVLQVAREFKTRLVEAIEDVRNGRRDPGQVRGWLRDVRSDHASLAGIHRTVEAMENELAALNAKTADEFQEDQFRRFPSGASGAPTLAALMAEQERKRREAAAPRLSRQQIDEDQDALADALHRDLGRGRFPGMRRPEGW